MQGCDGSILLDGSPSERDQPANVGIRPEALKTIEVLRSLVQRQCGNVVSCADLVVLAAREAVSLVIISFHLIIFILTFFVMYWRITQIKYICICTCMHIYACMYNICSEKV